ncbi:hypothetical protein FQB35_06735 [Crassaminicella thermophila]|uniref:BNR repeat-containing family member n=2 Tax=Crassaminicella thermophila TaxID=2599308 RepID=A0A5C0SFI6_CRATE|nr:hypothetical protein FQB35_06735 [Crassaminicella thermophila]
MNIIKNKEIYSTVKITENIIDYCVDIDDSGIFHLVSISSLGDLKYCIYRDNKWDCRCLTKYNAKSYKFKNLKLFIVNNKIHILIAISNIIHSNLWTLKHHYWNNESWVNKKVCDIISEKYDLPFHSDIDPYHNIHIVFKSLYDKKYQIYYCKYNTTYNTWSMPIRVSHISQDNSHPFIFCDSKNGTHITWSGFYNNNLEIFYLHNTKINSSKNYWSEIKRLSNEGSNSTHPFIFQDGNNLKVLWKQNNSYFSNTINLLDNTYSQPEKIQSNYNLKLFPISIIGNNYKSWTQLKMPISYGLQINYEFFIIGLDVILPKNNSTNTYNSTEICVCKNLSKESPKNEDKEMLSIDSQLQKSTDILEDIKNKQDIVNKLLNDINKQLEINEWKMNEIIQLLSTLHINIQNTNNHFWTKLKNLLK